MIKHPIWRGIEFKKKIFIVFVSIGWSIFLLFSIYFDGYMMTTLSKNELDGLRLTSQKISSQVDMLYRQLDNAATSFTSNQENINIMMRVNANYNGTNTFPMTERAELSQNLSTVYSIINNLNRIVIFIPTNNLFFSYIKSDPQIREIPDLYKVSLQDIEILPKIIGPVKDRWSAKEEIVLSVCHEFKTLHNKGLGYLEIQVPYQALVDICAVPNSNDSKFVFVIDEEGNIIYPYYDYIKQSYRESVDKFIGEVVKADHKEGKAEFKGEEILYSSYQSDYTNWTTVVVDNQSFFRKSLVTQRTQLIIFSILMLGVLTIICYIIILNITRPLLELTERVKVASLEQLSIQIDDCGHDELKVLNKSFEKMFDRLKQSIRQEYEAKIREVEAQYALLQSQINPHFIHNTLSVICARCEEGDSEVVVEMCVGLSNMLRYASSAPKELVTLEEELIYCTSYLELMMLHYEKDLSFSIDIPEEMKTLKMPKLTLQPIIENCINHGFARVLPPWRIESKSGGKV